ncbi:GNAT family N-acetyltransferase [Rouxiella sp. WC2420]|uniref:GNAT family N-acetyltransferase n=1 Tax=Rouxiella sp. WC2420 TaxID=3234145 RepID=A0AB39VKW5_9GAMM
MEYIGKSVKLCLVSIADYEFVHSIRVLPSSIKFLSQVDNNPLEQKRWLESYKEREISGKEYYFLIVRLDTATPVGTIRAYNVDNIESIAQCGSWILTDKKTLSSAIESILLMCQAMNDKGIKTVIVDARKDNAKALKFIIKISHRFHSEDDTNLYYEIDVPTMVQRFYKDNLKYLKPQTSV